MARGNCRPSASRARRPAGATATSAPVDVNVISTTSTAPRLHASGNELVDAACYNETEGWQCWRGGGSACAGISYTVAGMQQLVNAIRSAGANNYINGLMSWLDSEHTSYLAWTWNNWDCSQGPALVSDYSGDATPYGAGYEAHLQSLTSSG